ncbi:MAG: hypothetical protein ABSG68_10570 [Thermoguttaceae bacterium]|jgi:hypothetical protein
MKGMQGLAIAVALGICGAVLNLAYLASRARDVENVSFIAVKADASIARGETLSLDKLEAVHIPQRHVGNLTDIAILYKDLPTVENQNVCRAIAGGALLLRGDLKTPVPELELGPNEKAMSIPMDTSKFVPALIVPGEDEVSFVLSGPRVLLPIRAAAPGASPAPAPTPDPSTSEDPGAAAPIELVGPFKILALGNRLGNPEVFRAAKIPQVQENVMTIAVKVDHDGQLEPQAQKVWRMVAMNYRGVGVVIHKGKGKK